MNQDYETSLLYSEELAILLQRRNLAIKELSLESKDKDQKLAQLARDLTACEEKNTQLREELETKQRDLDLRNERNDMQTMTDIGAQYFDEEHRKRTDRSDGNSVRGSSRQTS